MYNKNISLLSTYYCYFAVLLFAFGPCQSIPIRWEIGQYGSCSKMCGRGIRKRSVLCKFMPENSTSADVTGDDVANMPEIMCPNPKPQSIEPCGFATCPPMWMKTGLGKCTAQCGNGHREILFLCKQRTGTGKLIQVPSKYCSQHKPYRLTRRKCKVKECEPKFTAEDWSECKGDCTKSRNGWKTRKVMCSYMKNGKWHKTIAKSKYCKHLKVLPARATCSLHKKCMSSLAASNGQSTITRRPNPTKINGGLRIFVQKSPRKTPLQLNLPLKAFVIPGTTIVAKCSFKTGPPSKHAWFINKRRVKSRHGSVMVTKNGSLKISKIRIKRRQVVKCSAGPNRSRMLVLMNKRAASGSHKGLVQVKEDNSPGGGQALQQSITKYSDRKHLKLAAGTKAVNKKLISSKKRKPHILNDYNVVKLQEIVPAKTDFLGYRERKHLPLDSKTSTMVVTTTPPPTDENGVKKAPSIHVAPTIDPLQYSDDVIVNVGGSVVVVGSRRVTILCEVTGETPINVKWMKEGQEIRNNDRMIKLGDGSLRIFNPETSDAGNYVCMATNQWGNDSRLISLTVTNKPTVLSTTRDVDDLLSMDLTVTVGSHVRARLGARVVIRCPTRGSPEPFVQWNKDVNGLQRNSQILIDNSLEIFPTTLADTGHFSCLATNPFGSSYQATILEIVDPPHISSNGVVLNSNEMNGLPELLLTDDNDPIYRVKANTTVMMGCPLTGYPELTIQWAFKGKFLHETDNSSGYRLMHNNKVLQIDKFNNESVGDYWCKGTNIAGWTEASLQLKITVYKWRKEGMTECSAECGNTGTISQKLVCIEDGVRKVDEWYCKGVLKPEVASTHCNRLDCPPQYYANEWSKCSVDCGNGTKFRKISCVVLMSDGTVRQVTMESCRSNQKVPPQQESCFSNACPEWKPKPWKQCSKKCYGVGVGIQLRQVNCAANNGTIVHKSHCKHLQRPERRQNCPNSRCKPVWRPSPWSVCSATCGNNGIKTRLLGCYYNGRPKQTARSRCPAAERPQVSAPCNRIPCNETLVRVQGKI